MSHAHIKSNNGWLVEVEVVKLNYGSPVHLLKSTWVERKQTNVLLFYKKSRYEID